MRLVLLFLIISGPFVSVAGAIGGVDGGGGKVVVCQDENGKTASVQLLDLWEAQTIYSETPLQLGPDLASSVDASLLALEYSYPYPATAVNCMDQECLLRDLRSYAAHFLEPGYAHLKRLRGVKLTPTDDSFELAQPAGNCEIQQVVNYQPDGTILMNQDFYELMSLVDQAALIVHESYYAFLRTSLANETNSIRTRRAIGYVTSGKIFTLPEIDIPQKHVLCHADGIPFAPTSIILAPAAPRPGYADGLWIYPELLTGSSLIGVDTSTFSYYIGTASLNAIISATCDRDGMYSSIGIEFSGPVELDHSLSLEWMCKSGQLSLFMVDTRPGEQGQPTPIELACAMVNSNAGR